MLVTCVCVYAYMKIGGTANSLGMGEGNVARTRAHAVHLPRTGERLRCQQAQHCVCDVPCLSYHTATC